jgi:hypothetical protein
LPIENKKNGGYLFLVGGSNRRFSENVCREQHRVVDMLFSEILMSVAEK